MRRCALERRWTTNSSSWGENRADASLRRRTEPGRDVEEPKPELEEEEVEEEEEEEPPDVTLKAPAPVNMSMTLVRNSFKGKLWMNILLDSANSEFLRNSFSLAKERKSGKWLRNMDLLRPMLFVK